MYSPDRAGFGNSEPFDKKNLNSKDCMKVNEQDKAIDLIVRDLWEFTKICEWKRFSIIGFSAGGLYARAMVAYYLNNILDRRFNEGGEDYPKLECVAIVAGLCCSAGVEGMMMPMQKFYRFSSTKDCIFQSRLRTYFSFSRGLLYMLPQWVETQILKRFCRRNFPSVDNKIIQGDQVLIDHMLNVLKDAFLQGSYASVLEAKILFRKKQGFENVLNSSFHSRAQELLLNKRQEDDFPKIGIFQGSADLHVPISHAYYTQDLFHGLSKLVLYDDLAHFTVFIEKMKDYIDFVSVNH